MKWRTVGRIALAAVVIVAAGAVWKREELVRLHRVNTLFDENRIVANFSAMDEAFLSRPVPRGDGPVRELPSAPRPLPETFVHGGGEEAVEAYLDRSATTSLLVLKDGAITHESYRLGTEEVDLRMSWSMAKSMVSTLIGIALAEGEIESLDDPADRYAPALAEGEYAGVTIRNLLHMASGVEFDEDYADFNSDINQMGRTLALGFSMDAFAAGQEKRIRPQGEAFRYVSIDTHALAMALRGATGKSVPELLSERIWGPMGAEADGVFLTDGDGAAFALGGMNARTRDYARFGLMIAEGGAWNGRRIVPEAWIAEATVKSGPPQAPESSQIYDYGYQWWIPPESDGEIVARGVYGQFMYIKPSEGVVIVKTSADRGFLDRVRRRNLEVASLFRAIAASLR